MNVSSRIERITPIRRLAHLDQDSRWLGVGGEIITGIYQGGHPSSGTTGKVEITTNQLGMTVSGETSFAIPWASVTKIEARSRPRKEGEGTTWDSVVGGIWTLAGLFQMDRLRSMRDMEFAARHQRKIQMKMMEDVTDVLVFGFRDQTGFESEIVFSGVKEAEKARAALIEARGKALSTDVGIAGGLVSVNGRVIGRLPEGEATEAHAPSEQLAPKPADQQLKDSIRDLKKSGREFKEIVLHRAPWFFAWAATIGAVAFLERSTTGVRVALFVAAAGFLIPPLLKSVKLRLLRLLVGIGFVILASLFHFQKQVSTSPPAANETGVSESAALDTKQAPAVSQERGVPSTDTPEMWLRYTKEMGRISSKLQAAFAAMASINSRYPEWSPADKAEMEELRQVVEQIHEQVKRRDPPRRYQEIHALYVQATEKFARAMGMHRKGIERTDADLLSASAKTTKAGLALIGEANRKLEALGTEFGQ